MSPWLYVLWYKMKRHLEGYSKIGPTEAPPINALPAEVFLDILLQTLDFDNAIIPQLHNLVQVCTYWFQSVLSTPRFWCTIDLENQDLAPVVLRRNPSGPLVVRCRSMGPGNPIDNFMEVAREQAYRWNTLELTGELDEPQMPLFSCPTPVLENLKIYDYDGYTSVFPLSTTSTLRHVSIHRIPLPWDSPSLVGLKSLSLAFMEGRGPSLRQIINILSSSPALEWFALMNITGPDDDEVPQRPIHLPVLRGLNLLYGHRPHITHHLLKIIDGPQCRILQAVVPLELIQAPGPTFKKLASFSMAHASCIGLRCFGTQHMTMVIYSSILARDYYRPLWPSDDDNEPAKITISITDAPSISDAMESVIDVLELSRITQMDVVVALYYGEGDAEPALLFGHHTPMFDSATAIHFDQSYKSATRIKNLRLLSNPVIENGHASWPCPRLTSLILAGSADAIAEDIAKIIIEFLERRSGAAALYGSGGVGVNITYDIPAQLKHIEADKVTIDLIRGNKILTGVQLEVREPNAYLPRL